MQKLFRPVLLLAILGTLSWSCGSSSSNNPMTPTPANGQSAAVLVPNSGGYSANGSVFQPPNVTIPVGGSVNWTNQDSVEHIPTANDGTWQGDLAPGGSFSMTFTKAGTYPYHCSIHPNMTGTITVQ